MLLKELFDRFDRVQWIFIRKDGRFRKVKKVISVVSSDIGDKPERSMFPISKDRK
jgi:hypothetical protein